MLQVIPVSKFLYAGNGSLGYSRQQRLVCEIKLGERPSQVGKALIGELQQATKRLLCDRLK